MTVTASIHDGASDDAWDPLADQTATVTVTDDDTPTLVLSDSTVATGEAGSVTFTAVLGAEPAGNVVFDLASSDTGAGHGVAGDGDLHRR